MLPPRIPKTEACLVQVVEIGARAAVERFSTVSQVEGDVPDLLLIGSISHYHTTSVPLFRIEPDEQPQYPFSERPSQNMVILRRWLRTHVLG